MAGFEIPESQPRGHPLIVILMSKFQVLSSHFEIVVSIKNRC
jgi:hypothetical protein